MIVRIAEDTQYEFPDDQADALNNLDNQLVEAVEAGDEAPQALEQGKEGQA